MSDTETPNGGDETAEPVVQDTPTASEQIQGGPASELDADETDETEGGETAASE